MSTVKGIGSFGSTALLVSSMTGPGLSTIPALFQTSGWVAPVFIFFIVAFLSGCSALFVCEALSNIRGNDKFQAKVELTTIAQVYLGTKYHYFFQLMLFLALQSVNVASIILAAQTFDSMLITIFKGTCGLGVYPGGWFCISADSVSLTGNSPFDPNSYFIFTFGFLLTGVMVIPLGFFSLVENIVVQITSFIVLTAVLIQWTVAFCQQGLDSSLLPASGSSSTMVLGIVIFNYSFITTIPSWVNSLKPDVNIKKCMWVSVIISTVFYLVLGILGAMAYKMTASSDILAILSAQGSTASIVTSYIFPVCALVTSIPVFTIVIRSNLVRGEICSNSWAIFMSNFFPWLVCIPLQTKSWVNTLQNWSSLFFQSTVNFILPFVLYFISRRYIASVEPLAPNEDNITQGHDEKNPSTIDRKLPFPVSPILHNPDDNDVRMYNPDDNYSISIRRSSIRPSKHSQMEQSILAYSPAINNRSELPTIIYSDINSFGDRNGSDLPHSPNLNVPTSPGGTPFMKIPRIRTSHNALKGPAGGLGISDPSSEVVSNASNTENRSPIIPSSAATPNTSSSIPGSPRSLFASGPNVKNESSPKPNVPLSPNMGKLLVPNNQPPKSPEISQASPVLASPSRAFHSHPSSMIASAHPFRSSSVAPEAIPEDGMVDENGLPISEEEMIHERDRFIAFQTTKHFNPFYLAVVSSAALSIAILFMIIYDLVLLGQGEDVFG